MDQYLIILKSNAFNNTFKAFLNCHNITYSYLNDVSIYIINTNKNCIDCIRQLNYIKSIKLDSKMPVDPPQPIEPIPSNDSYYEQIRLTNDTKSTEWYIKPMRFDYLFNKGFNGKDINVAIIGNGYITHNDVEPLIKSKVSFVNEPIDKTSNTSSSVATGIVASIATKCNLNILKVIDSKGFVEASSVVEAIEWCIDNTIDIAYLPFSISSAFGVNYNFIFEALRNAYSHGVITIGPSGDDNLVVIDSPSNSSVVLSVGAINKDYKRWVKNNSTGSNFGTGLDFVDPGYKIKVPVNYYNNPNAYALSTGTLPAGALLTALVTLTLDQYYSSQGMELSPSELKNILINSALSLPEKNPDRFQYGYGYDLARASLI